MHTTNKTGKPAASLRNEVCFSRIALPARWGRFFNRLRGAARPVCIIILAFALATCACREHDQSAGKKQESETNGSPSSAKLVDSGSKRPTDTMITSALRDTGGETDNSACLVCHLDMQEEELSVKHLEVGIVCAACHGECRPHREDELNVIKPDVLYGRAEIVDFCKTCHPEHKTGEAYDTFVNHWRGKRRPNGRFVLSDSVCTDCHGNHAILRPDQKDPE